MGRATPCVSLSPSPSLHVMGRGRGEGRRLARLWPPLTRITPLTLALSPRAGRGDVAALSRRTSATGVARNTMNRRLG